jgi:hypothetical protein
MVEPLAIDPDVMVTVEGLQGELWGPCAALPGGGLMWGTLRVRVVVIPDVCGSSRGLWDQLDCRTRTHIL